MWMAATGRVLMPILPQGPADQEPSLRRNSPGRRGRDRAQGQAEVAQLVLLHGRRRAGHGLLGLLVLGEGDDVADVVLTEPFHDQSLHAGSEAAVGRHPVLEGLEKEAEFAPRRLLVDSDGCEDPLLDGGVGDADAAAADLPAVENDVVGARTDAQWLTLEEVDVLAVDHG